MKDEFDRRLLEKLSRDMGPQLTEVLQHPKTVEVMCNPDGRVWLEALGASMRCIGTMPPAHAEAVIKTLASHLGVEVTREEPLLEGELPPDGARFAGQLPPVTTAPSFSIRRAAVTELRLGDYVEQGSLLPDQYRALREAVVTHRSILVTGGTGSGKTTFVNALIAEMVEADPIERMVILEDTREIRCGAENAVQLRSSRTVSMTSLLRTTLRIRPDRILVGEVRGPEALDLLMAWNTGHRGGAATLHANSAEAGLLRLRMLVSMHPDAPRQIDPLIAEAVDVVVHVARTAGGRRVEQVVEVVGLSADGFETREL